MDQAGTKRSMMAALLLVALAGCDDGGGGPVGDPGLRISRGDPAVQGWLGLTVIGSYFGESVGAKVVIEVGSPDRPPERLGYAETTVDRGGAFSVVLPDVLEPDLYKRKLVWVDVDLDGKCSELDPIFEDSSANHVDLAWPVGPEKVTFATCADLVTDWPSE